MKFNTFKIRLILVLVFSIPSYSFLYLIRGYDFSDLEFYSHATYSGIVFFILLSLFELHTLKSKKLEEVFPWSRFLSTRLLTEGAFTVLVTPAVVTFFVYLLYEILWDMGLWWPGVIEYNIFALTFSFLIAAFVNADVIIDEWKKSLLENEILEKENARARLSVLQAQVSPHFLFNNFNVLNALIEDDPKLAQKYLDSLSDIYRYILSHKNEELVPLKDEISFIEKYLFLLSIRFNDKLRCHINVSGNGNLKIPPATLQILVENAIKHNEISSRSPLDISIEINDEGMLEVRNNFQPKNTSVHSTEVGLKNISDRYRFLTDRSVNVSKTEDQFIVTIPVLKIK